MHEVTATASFTWDVLQIKGQDFQMLILKQVATPFFKKTNILLYYILI